MRPVVTPTEMAAIDAEAPESVDELIARAGWATARAALGVLGSAYGKRVTVLAGKGNNGADGRAAVPHLERAGARCTVHDLAALVTDGRIPAGGGVAIGGDRYRPEPPDLVIDACFGTGLRSPFDAMAAISALGLDPATLDLAAPGRIPVLAVDIPSGVDGATGEMRGRPLPATATVTFGAPKPGLLLLPGRRHVGRLIVADIGLDCSRATMAHLDLSDLGQWPRPADDDHKWRRAVAVIGGAPGMSGAPRLAALGALRAGAGYATLAIPGSASAAGGVAAPGGGGRSGLGVPVPPIEAVGQPMGEHWADQVLDGEDPIGSGSSARHGAVVVGPGLADTRANRRAVARWWAESEVPSVIDAGALTALAASGPGQGSGSRTRHVLTPHDGEFARLAGRPPGIDRVGAVRSLAAARDAVVLLKGPTTVVADPGGSVLVSTAGDARLATAGTGDVLAGIVAAGLAGGLDPFRAAGLGAELHGQAARRGRGVGLIASDLPALVAGLLAERVAGP